MSLKTPLTDLFGIKHPILLAGMNVAAGPKLAAAVTNAGGMGVIGGVGYTPKVLQQQIDAVKAASSGPFGVDLLLPKVGEGARATNYDYTEGHLDELIDIICKSGAKLFVSAVGVPPRAVVEKLHASGILVMNMVGAPKHVEKALDVGVDLICAQGGEGGGHTGDVPSTVLIPACVDICKNRVSPLTGKPVLVVAAGGIFDGRGLAAALQWGAAGVWVGTRFVASEEAGAPKRHKDAVVSGGFHDTIRTIIYTGRPMRVRRNEHNEDWETNRQSEIKELTATGKIPVKVEMEAIHAKGDPVPWDKAMPLLMGSAIGAINEVLPAKVIVDRMVADAITCINRSHGFVAKL